MGKPRTPNQKNAHKELRKRLNDYVLLIDKIYENLNYDASRIALSTSYDFDGEFLFENFPETRKSLDDLKRKYVEDIRSVIYRGTSKEWGKSNLLQDLLADNVLRSYTGLVNRKSYTKYYSRNEEVLKAFQHRKDRGLTLSAKLWKQSEYYKKSVETAISTALERGSSAVVLSKQISKYLKDFPTLQKDYKEKYGKSANIYDCQYHSARLARSEINIAYRTAEQTRWQQMDFIVGYEVKLSNNHNCKGVPKGKFYDICDELAGRYPKDFKFVGWHPQCRCYTVPILNTEEEFWGGLPSKNEVIDVPDKFKQWMSENAERYNKAKERGTLPYFVRDNEKILNKLIS